MKHGVAVGALALAAVLAANNPASSAGAIAEGIAPGGISKGYAISLRTDRSDMDAARADVLAGCRKGPEHVASGARPDAGQAKARKNCEVVATFNDKCSAVALDPKDGTPGAGWATGETQQKADDEALARCRSAAGSARRDFCKVTNRACDGSAK
jgi:hypothetical protein